MTTTETGGTYRRAPITMGIDDDNDRNGGGCIDEHNVPPSALTYDQ